MIEETIIANTKAVEALTASVNKLIATLGTASVAPAAAAPAAEAPKAEKKAPKAPAAAAPSPAPEAPKAEAPKPEAPKAQAPDMQAEVRQLAQEILDAGQQNLLIEINKKHGIKRITESLGTDKQDAVIADLKAAHAKATSAI
jgi:pyruvate/2-oxoglutarate dehydrogenase complex dihydrolipoamide acyltransferase (E2) component